MARARRICGSSSTTRTRVISTPVRGCRGCAQSWQGPTAGAAAASDTTMVRPPPGVSSGVERPAHGLGQPAGQRKPEADTGGVVGVAEALERGEHPVQLRRGDARTAVDDPELDAVTEEAAGDDGRGSGRAVPQGVPDQVRDDPFEQAGVGKHNRQVVGHVDDHLAPDRAEVVQGQRHHLVQGDLAADDGQHAGLQPAHVQQVVDQAGQPVEGLIGREQAARRGPGGSTRCRGCGGWSRLPSPTPAGSAGRARRRRAARFASGRPRPTGPPRPPPR